MDPVIQAHLDWLVLKGRSPNTLKAKSSVLTGVSRQLPVPLLAATEDMLLAWRVGLGDLAPGSIVAYLCHLNVFCQWAIEKGLRADNPAAGLPGPRRPYRLPRPIAYEDLVQALAASAGALRLWLVLAAWAGLRACEISRLRAECITLSGPAPGILIAADATKGWRERWVPLCPFAVGELARAALPTTGWAFRRADGRKGHPQPWRISQLCNDHLHDCGVAATLHMLRHWFGTEFYEASGRDLRATQEVMGHARPDTTAGYTKVRPGRAIAAVALMPAPRLLRAVS
jgi:integrase